MELEAFLDADDTESAVGYVPPQYSKDVSSFNNGISNRVPTPAELRKTVAELKGREIPLSFIPAIWLYTNLRVLHENEPLSWVLAETYRRIPESRPASIAKYKPPVDAHS